jgi:rod shape-determining protein MreD
MLSRPEYLLLPANPAFITFTLLAGFVLNVLPWGRAELVPDFLALVIVFWGIHQPRKVGMGIAFLFGMLMDVADASLLGEHALAYTLLSFGAIALHRRVLFFKPFGQMLHVVTLLLMAQLALLLVRMIAGNASFHFSYFYQSLVAVLLWPLVDLLLLAPQRRAVNRDDNRPL